MAKALTFSIGGRKVNGLIDVDRGAIADALQSWPDGALTFTIENEEARRSNAANRYYWGKVVKTICDYTEQDKETVHAEMCARFSTEVISYVNPKSGEIVEMEVVLGTSGMKMTRFHKFVEDVKLFAMEFFGLTFEEAPQEYHDEQRRALAKEQAA